MNTEQIIKNIFMGSRRIAPWIIAHQIIAPWKIAPWTIAPPPPGQLPPRKIAPGQLASRYCPPDNYHRVVTLQVIGPQTIAPSWLPSIILSSKIFYMSFTKNVFSFWARTFLSCIYLITVFDQLLLVPWYSNKIPIYRW